MFNQVLNVFSLESREIRRTAQHLWSWDAQTFAQQVNHGKLKQLLNICVLGKLKQLTNGFGPESWLLQTTADLFWTRVVEFQAIAQQIRSWVLRRSNSFPTLLFLISSKNCPNVFDSGLWKFKQLHNDFGVGKFKKQPNGFDLGYRKFKQLRNTCGLGKFKQLPNSFWFGSWEVQTSAQWFRSLFLRTSNSCRNVLDSGLMWFLGWAKIS